MKRHLSIIIALGVMLVFLVGCESHQYSAALGDFRHNKSENCIKVTDTTAHYKISGLLYTGDAINLWQDIQYLKDTEIRTIEIYLDSPGGDPYTGFAYVDIIRKAKKIGFTVNIKAYGQVASAVVPIIVVGSHRACGSNVGLMMHKPYMPESSMYIPEEVLEMYKASINAVFIIYAQIIADHTKLTVQEAKDMLTVKGSYFNAYKALEMGFVDEII